MYACVRRERHSDVIDHGKTTPGSHTSTLRAGMGIRGTSCAVLLRLCGARRYQQLTGDAARIRRTRQQNVKTIMTINTSTLILNVFYIYHDGSHAVLGCTCHNCDQEGHMLPRQFLQCQWPITCLLSMSFLAITICMVRFPQSCHRVLV